MASSKSTVAKKCWSRSTGDTLVHAFATVLNDGWNSLSTPVRREYITNIRAHYLQGPHLRRGSSAVNAMVADHVRLGEVSKSKVGSSSLITPLLDCASFASLSRVSSGTKAMQKGRDKRARRGSSNMAARRDQSLASTDVQRRVSALFLVRASAPSQQSRIRVRAHRRACSFNSTTI